ncbi:TPA: hypothetical protein OCA98_003767 [Escherichia coli]|nr:hypothetical protein [Escherichia coli]HCO9379025.1 hypothetical protein [Escherichia coli]
MNISWQTEIAIYRFGAKNVYGEAQLQFVRKTNVGVVKFEQAISGVLCLNCYIQTSI